MTEASYSTGTVAVTEDSATVTLTDGTWPSTVASGKYRFSLGTSDPWYEVSSRDSGTQITLVDNYIDDTETEASFIVHKPHYSLPSAVDRVEQMWIHDQGRMIQLENAATDQHLTLFSHYHSGPGTPTHYYNMERDSSDNRQVLLGPNTPNDVFRVEYTYKKKTTDGTYSLDDSRWPIVMALARSIAYEPEFRQRAELAEAQYQRLLEREWAIESETETQHVRVGQTRINFPDHQDHISRIPGFGRVSDPT